MQASVYRAPLGKQELSHTRGICPERQGALPLEFRVGYEQISDFYKFSSKFKDMAGVTSFWLWLSLNSSFFPSSFLTEQMLTERQAPRS